MRNKLSILPQYLVPQHTLSSLAGWLSECRWKWFKNWQINHLIKRYGVDLNAALQTDINDYPTFNSFFTRLLKPELRPIVQEINALASPVDGNISQVGHINDNQLFQAKGFHFSLEELLGNSSYSAPFREGDFATIYLSPKDYHRVHMPYTGTLRETVFIPGKLFSVNQKTVRTVPHLFARNERLICIFDTAFGPMAVILVGAMLVGSINTVWNEQPYAANNVISQSYPAQGETSITLTRGAELGHFKMGSTAIILFPKDKVTWTPTLQEGSPLQMGELIGNIFLS
ncbi:MAG: archaetidylserine decarboxylase [Gammaproteobacteria bacterium]|nr:archaetidylserine decarboxylase [Gammaproteobacteria bacterium]